MNVAFEVWVATKYLALKQSAADRNKVFELSLTHVRNLLRAKRCYYTGVPLNSRNHSIDRVDNSLGYVDGNVVACALHVNAAKNALTPQELKMIGRKMEKRFHL
jgi:hypothetical protein